jgi:hypothetical protein
MKRRLDRRAISVEGPNEYLIATCARHGDSTGGRLVDPGSVLYRGQRRRVDTTADVAVESHAVIVRAAGMTRT